MNRVLHHVYERHHRAAPPDTAISSVKVSPYLILRKHAYIQGCVTVRPLPPPGEYHRHLFGTTLIARHLHAQYYLREYSNSGKWCVFGINSEIRIGNSIC